MISLNIYEMAMQMVNFLILLFFVKRFLVRPLGEFLDKRSQDIHASIDLAESDKVKAQGKLDEAKKTLNEARMKAKEIRELSEIEAKKEKENTLSLANEEANYIKKTARQQMEQEVFDLRRLLTKEVVDLSSALTENFIASSEVSEEVRKKFFKKSIEGTSGER